MAQSNHRLQHVQAIEFNQDTSRHSNFNNDKIPDEVPRPGDLMLSTLPSSEDADSVFSPAMISFQDASPHHVKLDELATEPLCHCRTHNKSQFRQFSTYFAQPFWFLHWAYKQIWAFYTSWARAFCCASYVDYFVPELFDLALEFPNNQLTLVLQMMLHRAIKSLFQRRHGVSRMLDH
jgi:hypothetical protein